jgi:hypothetical protein
MRARWFSTIRLERGSLHAISALACPNAIRRSTSLSRAVKRSPTTDRLSDSSSDQPFDRPMQTVAALPVAGLPGQLGEQVRTARRDHRRDPARPLQRSRGTGQHPDPSDHPSRVRVSLAPRAHRPRDAHPRWALPTPTRPLTRTHGCVTRLLFRSRRHDSAPGLLLRLAYLPKCPPFRFGFRELRAGTIASASTRGFQTAASTAEGPRWSQGTTPSLLVQSSHDLGAAATHNRCCVRTKAAARAPAPMRTPRAIPIVRHGARRIGPARQPRRPYGGADGHLYFRPALGG